MKRSRVVPTGSFQVVNGLSCIGSSSISQALIEESRGLVGVEAQGTVEAGERSVVLPGRQVRFAFEQGKLRRIKAVFGGAASSRQGLRQLTEGTQGPGL